MLRKGALLQIIITLFCTLGVAALHRLGFEPLVRSESFIRDAITRLGRKTAPAENLVFLAIDNDSVTVDESTDLDELFDLKNADEKSVRALKLMSKGWPWSREVYGLMLERLAQAGAGAVVFDLTFPTATPNDPAFREALDRFRSKVVIGSNFVAATTRGYATASPSHSVPTETLVSNAQPIDSRVGFVNFWPDADDVIREAQYRVTFEQVNGEFTPSQNSERFISLAARSAIAAGFGHLVPPDLDSRIFRYTGPAQTFSPCSAFEIFVPEYWQRNYRNGDFFKNKIVVVGAYGNWQHDEHRTPMGLMPGPEIQLNALNALLHGEFIRELPPAAELKIIAFAGLVTFALWLFFRAPWLRFLAMLAVNALWLLAALELFNHASTHIISFTPLLMLNFNGAVALVYDVMLERREKTHIRVALEKYVSHNIVRELLDSPRDYMQSLGGVLKPVTILFSDIRNFTSISASNEPQAVITQLNEYFTGMVDCVFQHKGTLDKFIGDAVMAVWGNARSDGPEEDAANALRAALAMREKLAELNVKWCAEGRPELEIGIALNHGEAIVGNVGSARRMEFTVIGSAVNVSWRIQEATKLHEADLLLGEAVAELVQDRFDLQPMGNLQAAGVSETIALFAVLEPAENGEPVSLFSVSDEANSIAECVST